MDPMLRALRLPNEAQGDPKQIYWDSYDLWGPFVKADGSELSRWDTRIRVVWDASCLYVAFVCSDDRIHSDFSKRDDPLYEQEVVEVFLAPQGMHQYYEINLSPRNVVFDSLIRYADGTHHGDPSWDCAGLNSLVVWDKEPIQGSWVGYLAIPWQGLGCLVPRRGDRWAVNFYRIKRQDGDEYSCWSPTMTEPANFHVPERFGVLWFDE